jgi:hypothetical protein
MNRIIERYFEEINARLEKHIHWLDKPDYISDNESWAIATKEIADLCGEDLELIKQNIKEKEHYNSMAREMY